MRFLVDANLPPALAGLLVAQGHEAQHVAEEGLLLAADSAIWSRAIESNSIIVTKDKDFAQRKILTTAGPAVVWIRLPNTRRRELVRWFLEVLPRILKALQSGEEFIEVI